MSIGLTDTDIDSILPRGGWNPRAQNDLDYERWIERVDGTPEQLTELMRRLKGEAA